VHLVAEQVAVDRVPSDVVAVLARRPLDWLLPFLRLAGDTGEVAGLVALGESAGAAGAAARHQFQASPQPATDTPFRFDFSWRASAYRVLFRLLTGCLSVRPANGRSIVSVEAAFEPPPSLASVPNGPMAARRAAEVAARSLLGHLRVALEQEGPCDPGRTSGSSAGAPGESGRATLGGGPGMART
jgi:hypothetical protein